MKNIKNKHIGLLTFDLCSGRENLMPWKIFLQVSNYFQENSKNRFLIINVSEERYESNSNVISVNRKDYGVKYMENTIKEYSLDLIFVPLSWRLKKFHVKVYKSCKCKLVGYIPGSYYSIRELLPNFISLGLKNSGLYLLDALIPDKVFSFKLKKSNINSILCFNPETRVKLEQNLGAKYRCYDIFPGKDVIVSTLEKSEKYFLFFGAVSPIRGLSFLLRSFQNFRKENKEYTLKCLIRKDRFEKVKTLKNIEGVEFITGKLERQDFLNYISKCYAVVLPFLIVPSEIPISFWEAMQLQKPIITIPNGTVSSLLKNKVFISEKVTVKSLSNLLKVTVEKRNEIKSEVVENQNGFIAKVPIWKEVGMKWNELVNEQFSTQKSTERNMKNIMLSGADGTGKTTICEKLQSHYAKQEFCVVPIWLRFNHYVTKIVNVVGRITGKSYYEKYDWGKIGYHNYSGVIGSLYIYAVFIDHVIFNALIKPFVLKKHHHKIYLIDRYILDMVADLIVATKKEKTIFLLFGRLIKKELKLAKTFILECPKEEVVKRRADILDDKKYDAKIRAYNLISEKYRVDKLNTGKFTIDEIVSKIVNS